MKKWNGVKVLVFVAVVAAMFMNGTDFASADEGDDPTPNVEAQGKWVLVTDQCDFDGNKSRKIYKLDESPLGDDLALIDSYRIVQKNKKPLKVKVYGKVWCEIPFGGSRSVINNGHAECDENRIWKWKGDAPIENKAVTVVINGTGQATISVTINDNESVDCAASSADFDALGVGHVGGIDIAGMKIETKSLKLKAYIEKSENRTKYFISGTADKTEGGGDITATANTKEWVVNKGNPADTETIVITAAITGTGNTNDVPNYAVTLSQGISGSIALTCSNYAESKASAEVSSNFKITE